MRCKAAASKLHAGASFPREYASIAKETKLTKNRLESLALQNELLAFSGFAGLRIFATFLRLDQADPPLKSRAPRAQNSLRIIGWSEVSSVKVDDVLFFTRHVPGPHLQTRPSIRPLPRASQAVP